MRRKAKRKEYDLSKGERGKFNRKNAKHNLPIYLDADNLLFVTKLAELKKSDISDVVNELIRSDGDLARVLE